MKITCTQKEFAQLIRACDGEGNNLPCVGCLLEEICGDELPEDAVEFEIQEDA